MFEGMNRMVEPHGLRPVIHKTLAFDEVRAALAHPESRAH